MTDAASSTGDTHDGPPAVATERPSIVHVARLPRAGDLSPGWRLGTIAAWIGVIVALAAVWNASVQLGLSTWWLGPRAQPRPLPIRLTPFAAPALMILAAINQVRWLGWFGLAAAGATVAVGVGDLGRFASIGATEIAIGVAAAAMSLASLTGTYRRDPAATAPTSPID